MPEVKGPQPKIDEYDLILFTYRCEAIRKNVIRAKKVPRHVMDAIDSHLVFWKIILIGGFIVRCFIEIRFVLVSGYAQYLPVVYSVIFNIFRECW